jgi:hypothetical protein
MKTKLYLVAAAFAVVLWAFADGVEETQYNALKHTAQKQIPIEVHGKDTIFVDVSAVYTTSTIKINRDCYDWLSLIASFLATLGGIITTIIIAWRKYKKDQKIRDDKKINEIKNTGNIIFMFTKDAITISNSAMNEINNYIKHETHTLNTCSFNMLKSFNPQEVKKSFSQFGLSNEYYVNFYRTIDNLENEYAAINRDYTEVKNKTAALSNRFSEIYDDIYNKINDYLVHRKHNDIPKKSFDEIIDECNKKYSESLDINDEYENLMKIKNNVVEYGKNVHVNSITTAILKAQRMYNEITNTNKQFIETLTTKVLPSLRSSTQKLESMTEELAKHYEKP